MTLVSLLVAAAALAAVAAMHCGVAVNCSQCALQRACFWCASVQVGSGACVDRQGGCQQGTSVYNCTALHELPCFDAQPGDICLPALAPDPVVDPASPAVRLVGRVLHGSFATVAGVRSALPETVCVGDAHRLGRLGECLCRNFTVLQQMAADNCRQPQNLDFTNRKQAQYSCTALVLYRGCLLRTFGRACFSERFDRLCSTLDADALARVNCRACTALRSESIATFLLSDRAPLCALLGGTGEPRCAKPFFINFATRIAPCAKLVAQRQQQLLPAQPAAQPGLDSDNNGQPTLPFDHAFATWMTARIEKNSTVLQVGYDHHQCFALYMASSTHYRWIVTAADGRALPDGWAPFDVAAPMHAQFMTADDTARATAESSFAVDWILALDLGDRLAKADGRPTAVVLTAAVPLLARCRYAVVLAIAEAAVRSAALEVAVIDAMHAHGFLYDHDLTTRARYVSVLPGFKHGLVVFIRRQLAARAAFPDFLRTNNSAAGGGSLPWNEQVVLGQTRLRLFVPPTIAWTGSDVLISVHSDARFVDWRAAVRATWVADAVERGMRPIFIVCSPDAAAFAEAAAHGDMVAIDAPFVYFGEQSVLPLLEQVWFQLVARLAVRARWVMKADQDTLVLPFALQRFLVNQSAAAIDPLRDMVYAGSLFEVGPMRNPKHRSYVSLDTYPPLQYPGFMSGGAGYIESIALVRCLVAHTASPAYNYFPRSDAGMRLAINEAGCQPLRIVSAGNFRYDTPPIIGRDMVTLHYVKHVAKLQHYWQQYHQTLLLLNETRISLD